MEDIYLFAERCEQRLKTIERDVAELRERDEEIRELHETLIKLSNELSHTTEQIERQERKLEEIDEAPKKRIQQITAAIITALAGAVISFIAGMLFSS